MDREEVYILKNEDFEEIACFWTRQALADHAKTLPWWEGQCRLVVGEGRELPPEPVRLSWWLAASCEGWG